MTDTINPKVKKEITQTRITLSGQILCASPNVVPIRIAKV